MSLLESATEAEKMDFLGLMTRAAGNGGPGPWGQLRQILWNLIRRRGFTIDDYYTYGFWLRPVAKRMGEGFLTGNARTRYNAALKSRGLPDQDALISDKIATEILLAKHGINAVRTLAQIEPGDRPDYCEKIETPADLRRFLETHATTPIFGKPRNLSLAAGVIGIEHLSVPDGIVTLTDGEVVGIDTLISDIFGSYAGGYLFQRRHRAGPELQRHAGAVIPGLRLVTIRTSKGVVPFYAVLKFPSKGAMHDGASRTVRAWANVDCANGQVVRIRPYREPHKPDLTHWQNPDEPLLGMTLPNWDAAVDLAVRAHELFPAHGIIGADIFLTDQGPLINELNANPGHLYQVAAAVGLRTGRLEEIYQDAKAFAKTR